MIYRQSLTTALFVAAILTFGLSDATRVSAHVAQTPSPTPTPKITPSVSPTVTPAPTPVQTLESLRGSIRSRLLSADVRRGRVGIKIVTLGRGTVVFENDAEKYFMPASNMKNFTVATALDRLGPDFRYRTTVTSQVPATADGIISGPLTIVGSGDISMSPAFDPRFPTVNDPYYGIDQLADKIVAAGVRRIDGDLIGDESYFKGNAIPVTWEWDDLQTYYGTEISALPLNDNSVDIAVRPGTRGGPCVARVIPANTIVRLVNKCTTTGGGGRNVVLTKKLDQNVIEISGSMPANDSEFRDAVAFSHPAELFVAVLKERLQSKGVIVNGTARVAPPTDISAKPAPVTNVTIATLESQPLSTIAQKTMKPSQNMYTETLLWTLGEQVGRAKGGSGESGQLGLGVVKSFLQDVGIPGDGIVQYDGSGLSRHNLITPAAVTSLYTYMASRSPASQAWRESLTIGGVDGTLRNRFKGTVAAANVRGKTGTIDQVSALSGYITTAGGESLAFSIVVNGVPTPRDRTSLIDAIVLDLANFNGRVDN